LSPAVRTGLHRDGPGPLEVEVIDVVPLDVLEDADAPLEDLALGVTPGASWVPIGVAGADAARVTHRLVPVRHEGALDCRFGTSEEGPHCIDNQRGSGTGVAVITCPGPVAGLRSVTGLLGLGSVLPDGLLERGSLGGGGW
jgi:hypothetical protein